MNIGIIIIYNKRLSLIDCTLATLLPLTHQAPAEQLTVVFKAIADNYYTFKLTDPACKLVIILSTSLILSHSHTLALSHPYVLSQPYPVSP